MRMAAIFSKVCELALAQGHAKIYEIPGCLEISVDDRWWIALNPHKVETACTKETQVPPMNVYIEFNGWPAGLVGVSGGCLVGGAAANEEELIRVLDSAIKSTEVSA